VIRVTVDDAKRVERAVERFNSCGHAGAYLSIEVDRKAGTKTFMGFCGLERRKVDVEPTCRICVRHSNKKKKKSKKTPATRARIRKGRQRQREKREDHEDYRNVKTNLDRFR
jgi:hypothetical protein